MILVGLGANLPGPAGAPMQSLDAAVRSMQRRRIRVCARSTWLTSPPVDGSDQPNYVNGVVAVTTGMSPQRLLATLHEIEVELGRTRSTRWAARCLDLDLLDYEGLIIPSGIAGQRSARRGLGLPHPEIGQRRFVLQPIAEIAPSWRHPVSGLSAMQLLARLRPDRRVKPTQV